MAKVGRYLDISPLGKFIGLPQSSVYPSDDDWDCETVLGNPTQSPLSARTKRDDQQDEEIRRCGWGYLGPHEWEEFPTFGWTRFLYKEDKERYDAGHFIEVTYDWNVDSPNCVENDVLKNEFEGLDSGTFKNQILPKIGNLLPFLHLRMETINGSLTIFPVTREAPEMSAMTVPDSLGPIPRIPISSLRKCPATCAPPKPHTHIAAIDGDPKETWYIFKPYGYPHELDQEKIHKLLSEVEILNSVDSPYIMKPSFLVTDDSKDFFIGYLRPLIPAGTLEQVFEKVGLSEGPVSREPFLVHPKLWNLAQRPEHVGGNRREKQALKPSVPQLRWNVKQTWGVEAASALATLHDANIIGTNSLNLSHILLGRDGHLRFISMTPARSYSRNNPYAAPEFDINARDPVPHTEARDIYALGVVLWQIAEEEGKITRNNRAQPFELTWRSDVPGSTPQWYRDLVGRCVDSDPAKRPSAKVVLAVLESTKLG